jgi:hypothetical protein
MVNFGSGLSGLGYLNGNQLSKLQKEIGEVERMLQALIKSLENKPLKPSIRRMPLL